MTAEDFDPAGLRILRTTVYYDDNGAILHVHRVAAAAGDDVDDARVRAEAAAFEENLERRHGRTPDHIEVDERALEEAVSPDVTLRVDVARRSLVRE